MTPILRYPPEMLLLAQGVRVAFFDVDGVMTNGGVYLSSEGETLKQFNSLDGYGLKLLQAAGIVPVVITGRDSRPLRLRLDELGIGHAHFAVQDKLAAAQTTLRSLDLQWNQAAAMGDDWPDLALMRQCAIAGAPKNAHVEVAAVAHYVTTNVGGEGAVREFCDLLLVASGKYAGLLRDAAP